jgi:hypothetical protein
VSHSTHALSGFTGTTVCDDIEQHILSVHRVPRTLLQILLCLVLLVNEYVFDAQSHLSHHRLPPHLLYGRTTAAPGSIGVVAHDTNDMQKC